MIKLNKKTYKALQPYETYFRQAYYGCYLMNMSALKITNILEIVRKCGYVGSVTVGCNSCKLKFMKEIGKEYFEYQKSLEKGDN
jgi:hypothetical protein